VSDDLVRDDTRRRLEEAGRRPAPPPNPAFADRLETRLVAVARTATPAPDPGGPHRARGRWSWLLLSGTVMAALLVVVVMARPGAFPGSGADGSPTSPPELAQPVNVDVALSDGTVLEDPDGMRLPDGAVVSVGNGGYARIGNTVLGPGDVATIEHGRVHVEHDQAIGEVPPTPPAATGHPGPSRSPSPRRTQKPEAATPTPTPAPAKTPAPTPSPTPRRTPAPTATPTPAATPTPTPTPQPTVLTARPRLRARLVAEGTRVAVRWTATVRAASYLLIVTRGRNGPAPLPVYPGSRVLAEFAHPPAVAFRFWIPDRVTEVKLLVVALGPYGHVVSRSRIVTLDTGGDVAAAGDPTPTPVPSTGVEFGSPQPSSGIVEPSAQPSAGG